MPDPDGSEVDPTAVDQVSSAPASRSRGGVVSVGVVRLALVVTGAGVAHRPHHRRASAAPPGTPTVAPDNSPGSGPPPATAVATPTSPRSVFLEHLGGCTRTDHRRGLTLAFAVTNLSAAPLRLLSATPLFSDATLRLTRVRIGTGPCASGARDRPVRLVSAGRVVVAMSFGLGVTCPRHTQVQARVTFRSGSRLLHADSSELADLSHLAFTQC